ncbi:MAG: RNase adapter RapZ [Oscillospiraceae bacterium]|nr:RNase adapter RapZ [Oscillospiraceae bacterium]
MKIVVVTGMSGAGKSSAINFFEDMDYYCIDNMPPELLIKFTDLISNSDSNIDKIAVAVDMRSGEMFARFEDSINELKAMGIDVSVLFIDCDDDKLLNRYKETRRKHPLDSEASGNLVAAIEIERKATSHAKEIADFYIDSTNLKIADFKDMLREAFFEKKTGMVINVISFGFKYGNAKDADLVFDVRCLPNPFYIPNLKLKTGLNDDVYNYVMGFSEADMLFNKIYDMIKFLIPLYEKEGKSRLTIAFGCTGGKHRSVSFARRLSEALERDGLHIRTEHRHIEF